MSEEFDLNEALSRCGGDADLLRELIDMFQTEIPGWMGALEKGIADGQRRADPAHRAHRQGGRRHLRLDEGLGRGAGGGEDRQGGPPGRGRPGVGTHEDRHRAG